MSARPLAAECTAPSNAECRPHRGPTPRMENVTCRRAVTAWLSFKGLVAAGSKSQNPGSRMKPESPGPLWGGLKTMLVSAAVLSSCAHFDPKPITSSKNVNLFESRTFMDEGLKAYLCFVQIAAGPSTVRRRAAESAWSPGNTLAVPTASSANRKVNMLS